MAIIFRIAPVELLDKSAVDVDALEEAVCVLPSPWDVIGRDQVIVDGGNKTVLQ